MPEKQELAMAVEALRKAPRETIIQVIEFLLAENAKLKERVEALEAKLNRNSSNSNKPPSSDSPFDKKGSNQQKKKRKSRKGYRQQMLEPNKVIEVAPGRCSCGCDEFDNLQPYYTHQHIELPEIIMLITHFVLLKGSCRACGKSSKGYIPPEYRTGYGSRLSALIAEIGGIDGNSRETIKMFCDSVLNIPISLGAIQKVIDRASEAITPHYEAIKEKARSMEINHLDETPWHNNGTLNWLWVMANKAVAFFMIHSNRSKEAFEQLIGAWVGILVSDNYGVYQKWANQRQNCLAHLIRKAKGLAERADPELCRFGAWATKRRVSRLLSDKVVMLLFWFQPLLGPDSVGLCRPVSSYGSSRTSAPDSAAGLAHRCGGVSQGFRLPARDAARRA